VQDGDAVVLINFRADRMVEMSKALEYDDFTAFHRKRFPKAPTPSKPSRSLPSYLLRL